MFADEEGKLFRREKFEGSAEMILQIIERNAGRLILAGRVGLHPGRRGGDDEVAPRLYKRGETVEETPRLGEAAEQVRGVDEVEGTEIFAQVHRVAGLVGDPVRHDARRHGDGERLALVHFPVAMIGERFTPTDRFGGVDESGGKIDPDHFAGDFGKLQGRATDRAAEVEGSTDFRGESGRLHRGHGEVETAGGQARGIEADPVEDLRGRSIMEEQIPVAEDLAFVIHRAVRSIRQQGHGADRRIEVFASFEEGEFDEEGEADDFAAELLDQF